MKINIARKELDRDLITEVIREADKIKFEKEYSECHYYEMYLIMSQETMDALKYLFEVDRYINTDKKIAFLYGYPIAICNQLAFGEIEVR